MRRRDLLRVSTPEEYQRLAAADTTRDEARALAEWHGAAVGAHMLCARGRVWRCVAAKGKRWAQVFADGSLDREVGRPWWPCVCEKLPIWPVMVLAPVVIVAV